MQASPQLTAQTCLIYIKLKVENKIRFWNIPFIVLLLGAFVTVFNIGVTGVAIPSIAKALNANGLQIHLIADSLTLTLSAFVLLAGALGDKYGRKKLFIAGSCLMLVASTFMSFSTDANVLIFWRFVAGIATAMLFPTTLSMISTIFQNPKQKILAIGMWSGVAAGGAAIAPVVSGLLLHFFPWGAVYLISAPITFAAILLGFFYLHEVKNQNAPSIDYLGGFLSVIAISCLLFSIILYPVAAYFYHFVLLLFAAAITSFVLFVIRELTTKNPLLNVRVFKNIRFSVACFVITLVAFAQLGVMFLAQLFVQNVLGYNTIQAGLSPVPLALAVVIFSPISAKLDARFGSKLTIASGLFFVGFGFATALFWTTHSSYLQIFLSYITIGIGMGLTMTPATNTIMNSLPAAQAGVASAMNDITRDLGDSLGIAINGSIAAVSYSTLLHKVYNNLPPAERIPISQNVASTITSSLTGAISVADRYPANANELLAAARQAFLHGQINAMMLSVILCAIGIVVVMIFMPGRQTKSSD